MSLAITLSQKSYAGNGVQVAFPTGFSFGAASHLTVEVDEGSGFVTKTLGVDYTVTGAGAAEPGGTVTFLAAPANPSTVRITRDTPRTQPTDFENEFDFLPETHEEAFDHVGRQVQELERRMTAAEAGATSVDLDSELVSQPLNAVPDPATNAFPFNVNCSGTPVGVQLVGVHNNTDPSKIRYDTSFDWGAPTTNQFTVKYVGGLEPGDDYELVYLVLYS